MAHLFFPLLLSTRLIDRARLAITGVVFDRLDHNLEGALNLPQAFDGVGRGVQGQGQPHVCPTPCPARDLEKSDVEDPQDDFG